MSTRAWYEYYVVDAVRNTLTLAFQFYKWGDGGPENALAELAFLNDKIQSHQGQLPVVWLDDLLREQLHDLYFALPDHFSLAAFLFLLQRAHEEGRRWPTARALKIPEQERPDYRLGFATGFAIALNGFQPRGHPDLHLDRVRSFVAAGHFVRPWKYYGSLGVERYSLDAALAALSMTPDRFWSLSSYERPPIIPQTECT